MTENDGSTTETSVESETPTTWVPQRLTDEEARQRITDILLNAASESGTVIDKDSIDAAAESIFDAMKKTFG